MNNAKLNYLYRKLERLELEMKELESNVPFTQEMLSKTCLLQMDIHEVRFHIEEIEDGTEESKGKIYHKLGDFYFDVSNDNEKAWHGKVAFSVCFFGGLFIVLILGLITN